MLIFSCTKTGVHVATYNVYEVHEDTQIQSKHWQQVSLILCTALYPCTALCSIIARIASVKGVMLGVGKGLCSLCVYVLVLLSACLYLTVSAVHVCVYALACVHMCAVCVEGGREAEQSVAVQAVGQRF